MKSSLRAFGIGLFVAGACMALFDQLSSDSNEKEIAVYEKQVKDYEKQIAELSKQLKEQNPVSADPSKVDKQTNSATAENTSVTKKKLIQVLLKRQFIFMKMFQFIQLASRQKT